MDDYLSTYSVPLFQALHLVMHTLVKVKEAYS